MRCVGAGGHRELLGFDCLALQHRQQQVLESSGGLGSSRPLLAAPGYCLVHMYALFSSHRARASIHCRPSDDDFGGVDCTAWGVPLHRLACQWLGLLGT